MYSQLLPVLLHQLLRHTWKKKQKYMLQDTGEWLVLPFTANYKKRVLKT